MSQYVFATNTDDQELGRLRMIEAANDQSTIQLLQRTGIQHGWNCLELGPGAGSIMKWMGETVGPDGLVIGVDKKTVYLREFSLPPYDIREDDFLEVHLDDPLDLVHGRYFLIHNKQDLDILTKIRGLLKPGGFAVFEEPDFTSAKFLNDPSDIPHQKVNAAMNKMFVDFGLNPAYGVCLPQKLRAAGFHITEAHSNMHLCGGNSPISNLMAESAQVLSSEYMDTGEATEEDIQHYVRNAHNPDYWSVYYSTVSVITKVPN